MDNNQSKVSDLDYADLYALESKIAAFLDGNSVYMGGPSQGSRRRAKELMRRLFTEYDVIPKGYALEVAARVRTWMNPDGSRKDKS